MKRNKSDGKSERKYAEVIIPLTDVYDKGGRDVLEECGNKKGGVNLVVYPSIFNNMLEPGKSRRSYESLGGEDVTSFLKGVIDDKNMVREIPFLSGPGSGAEGAKAGDGIRVTLYRASPALHVAYVDYPTAAEKDFSVTSLERAIESWKVADNDMPVLMTTKPKYHMKYKSRGLRVEDPAFMMVNADIVNNGIITGSEKLLSRLHDNNRVIKLDEAADILGKKLFLHQFIRFMSPQDEWAMVTGKLVKNPSGTRVTGFEDGLVKLVERGGKLHVGNYSMDSLLGIKPRDMEQYIALQYGLLDPDTSLFFLCGSQGSGKTLLAYLAAVELMLRYDANERILRKIDNGRNGSFEKMVLLKPNDPMGGTKRDDGLLPGDLYTKTIQHLMPYVDAHKMSDLGSIFPFKDMFLHPVYSNDYGDKRSENANKKIKNAAYLPNHQEVVELVTSAKIRGRSLPNTILIIDEAQNFTPYEMRTILSRLSEGCKAFVLGDPEQFDNPDCSREVNGLTYAIKHYFGRLYVGLGHLTTNYRSQISEDANSMKAVSGRR